MILRSGMCREFDCLALYANRYYGMIGNWSLC